MLALRIHKDEALADTSDKRLVIDELLKGAMAQVNFAAASNTCFPHKSNTKDEELPETFIITCIEADSDSVMSLVFDKLIGKGDSSSQHSPATGISTLLRTLSRLQTHIECWKWLKDQPGLTRLLDEARQDIDSLGSILNYIIQSA